VLGLHYGIGGEVGKQPVNMAVLQRCWWGTLSYFTRAEVYARADRQRDGTVVDLGITPDHSRSGTSPRIAVAIVAIVVIECV
jgi:hypothetical protein